MSKEVDNETVARFIERAEAVAAKVTRALKSKRPRLTYKINRNPLLLMLNALPQRLQLRIIRKLLS